MFCFLRITQEWEGGLGNECEASVIRVHCMKLPKNQLNDYIAGKKRIVKIRPNRIYKEEHGFVKSLF